MEMFLYNLCTFILIFALRAKMFNVDDGVIKWELLCIAIVM